MPNTNYIQTSMGIQAKDALTNNYPVQKSRSFDHKEIIFVFSQDWLLVQRILALSKEWLVERTLGLSQEWLNETILGLSQEWLVERAAKCGI